MKRSALLPLSQVHTLQEYCVGTGDMSEADSNSNRSKQVVVDWSYLPQDLLSQISNSLGPIEFLRFRAVCKVWQNASTITSPDTEPSDRELWFLMYGEDGSDQCFLQKFTEERLYTFNKIPEMDGRTTCLASFLGWLLLFREGSMFFFCPISRSKIELPSCPFTELKDHIAAFSSDPTCQECVVVVATRKDDEELEIHVLRRGEDQWCKQSMSCDKEDLGTIKGAVFDSGEFHFLDGLGGLVTFDAKSKITKEFRIVTKRHAKNVENVLNYVISGDRMAEVEKMMQGMDASVCTCGTMVKHPTGQCEIVILGGSRELEGAKRSLKGVWIQPRCFQIPLDQTW